VERPMFKNEFGKLKPVTKHKEFIKVKLYATNY
jgi:hypothetical protein